VDQSDRTLRQRLLSGDDRALAEVYDRYFPMVYAAALRATGDHASAEDVTQEVFVALWERPEAYEPARGALRAWLCTVARNRGIDLVRRGRTRQRVTQLVAAVPPEVDDPEAPLVWQSVVKVLRTAIAELPTAQREALLLAYFGGRTYREVAAELGVAEGTAKSRLRLALRRLADRLAAEGIVD
jgi:RNA polymerase sigma-70 factor (ECF subfamily)